MLFIIVTVGITSTCVENTVDIQWYEPTAEDHLHMRGEYDDLKAKREHAKGSPPHAWRILKNLV